MLLGQQQMTRAAKEAAAEEGKVRKLLAENPYKDFDDDHDNDFFRLGPADEVLLLPKRRYLHIFMVPNRYGLLAIDYSKPRNTIFLSMGVGGGISSHWYKDGKRHDGEIFKPIEIEKLPFFLRFPKKEPVEIINEDMVFKILVLIRYVSSSDKLEVDINDGGAVSLPAPPSPAVVKGAHTPEDDPPLLKVAELSPAVVKGAHTPEDGPAGEVGATVGVAVEGAAQAKEGTFVLAKCAHELAASSVLMGSGASQALARSNDGLNVGVIQGSGSSSGAVHASSVIKLLPS